MAANAPLPNPFVTAAGTPVTRREQWPARRAELFAAAVGVQYGGLPPTPARTWFEHLHTTQLKSLGDARYMTCRVQTGPPQPYAFHLSLAIPPGDGPFPVVLCGDACWRTVKDEILAEVLGRRMILAHFNRCELAPDVYSLDRTSGIYPLFPELPFGALAAWAWGYHRCVDVLEQMPFARADRIAVVGHSRGGKTSLLAGATDSRIAFTAANNSGAGGAGCYRWQGPQSETLEDTMRAIRYWFGPTMPDYLGRVPELPFDQHDLKALVAPRPLFTSEALGDLWANPTGTWRTHLAAREVYRFLGVPDAINLWYREGGHEHGPADWRIFLDVFAWQCLGGPRPAGLNEHPFGELEPAFAWSAPAG
ncbi:MAG: hypothetical protein IT204_24280 [Fimbriimonadaceae bacterium]|nr:hypothetical protein [Fimbriimonadaceae bacterium]